MMRTSALALVVSLVALAPARAGATEAACRARVAAKAGVLYIVEAKKFNACAQQVTGGGSCNTASRDATVASKLASTRSLLIAGCDAPTAAALGFPTNGDLAIRVAGTAAGEGRQVVDSVYGRNPSPLSSSEITCARTLALEVAKAGKKLVKTLAPCGSACGPTQIGAVDGAFARANTVISQRCSPGELNTLVGGNLADHLATTRAGAQRIVDALHPGAKALLSVVTPTAGSVVTPPGLPASVPVTARVTNVPHAGYVNSVHVNGQDAGFVTGSDFSHTLLVGSPHPTFPIFLEARTTFGTVPASTNVRFNLGTIAPGVVITSPASGTITPASSITISGHLIGNLGAADALVVGGQLTTFNPTTGDFSRSVSLGAGSVHIIEASVQSLSLGTTNTDSVVVLEGTALPLSSRVPTANTNRMNNSGFAAASSLIEGTLNSFIDPSTIGNLPINGGHVCEFSLGTRSSSIFGAGANTVEAEVSINNVHIKVCDFDIGIEHCDGTVDANNVSLVARADLVGQLQANVTSTQVGFSGTSVDVGGGFFCEALDLFSFLLDVENAIQSAANSAVQSALPGALNSALAGINISGPIGAALDVNIDAVYANIPEDAAGVSFIVDSNVTALSPVPDAPPITQTLVPTAVGPPVLGPNIPGTGMPYDLGFCLSDGFVNRAMAAFMLQGRFNQSLTSVPVGMTNVPLSTAILQLLLGDSSYSTACPGCPVTLILRPTAAAVSRGPNPGENAGVVLVVPNYRIDAVADSSGTPVPLVSGLVTFELPITLNVSGISIAPTVGALSVTNAKVVDNPIGANETAFATGVSTLFPLAAQALGGLFSEIPLPTFQGLAVSGVGSGYNVSCTAIYLNLGP
jgi:hypothetical protein